MRDTGRIHQQIDWRIRRVLYGQTADALIDADLEFEIQVDLAHLVMMSEAGLIPLARAARVALAIMQLRDSNFAALRGRPAERGLYLLLEDHLIAEIGELDGGSLQLGRSRNDLGPTAMMIRLRRSAMRLISEASRLLAALIHRARAEANLVMPGYTHMQPAQPITIGHYLSGVAFAVVRDLLGLTTAIDGMGVCPLGAGAMAGTTLPIRPMRTAELLGFDKPVLHSLDAVASRDVILRLLSAATIFGITLTRLATDLLLWSSEFGLIGFPDRLSGSSSMMPQKKNAFPLELIQGRAMAPLGAFTAASAAMTSKPFTNAIAVGTEGVGHVWNALGQITDATLLARLAVRGFETHPDRMRERAETGYVTATACADVLARQGTMSFRQAHRLIGRYVNEAIARGGAPLAKVAGTELAELTSEFVVSRANYGGGPGPTSMAAILTTLEEDWRDIARWKHKKRSCWASAASHLDDSVQQLLNRLEAEEN
jgi:argininosuccinate lyase